MYIMASISSTDDKQYSTAAGLYINTDHVINLLLFPTAIRISNDFDRQQYSGLMASIGLLLSCQ